MLIRGRPPAQTTAFGRNLHGAANFLINTQELPNDSQGNFHVSSGFPKGVRVHSSLYLYSLYFFLRATCTVIFFSQIDYQLRLSLQTSYLCVLQERWQIQLHLIYFALIHLHFLFPSPFPRRTYAHTHLIFLCRLVAYVFAGMVTSTTTSRLFRFDSPLFPLSRSLSAANLLSYSPHLFLAD